MPADLESEMREMGARLLAEAPPVTTDEIVHHAMAQRPSTATIDPLITNVPLVSEPRSPRRRHRRYVLAGTVAAASVLAVGLAVANRAGEGGPTAVGTASTVALGTAAPATSPATTDGAVTPTSGPTSAVVPGGDLAWPPRVLFDDSWQITDTTERSRDEGYMTFERDGVVINVGWYRFPSADVNEIKDDYAEVATGTMLGQSVPIYQLVDSGPVPSDPANSATDGSVPTTPPADAGVEYSAQIREEDVSLNIQVGVEGPGLSLDDFTAAISTLSQVEPAGWYAALPDDVVTPEERAAAVDEMMTDVPVPGGFDVASVRDQVLAQNRPTLADKLVHDVACAWLDQYFNAAEGNNADGEAAARDALVSISDWAMFADAEYEASFGSFVANDDGTITYEGSGNVLTRDFAETVLCVHGVG